MRIILYVMHILTKLTYVSILTSHLLPYYTAQHFRLLVFVVILALSNLGTSFASAILAKDTTTNSESGSSELVDKKTGEVVATDQAVKRFTAEVLTDDDPFTRGLAGRTNEYGVSTSSFSRMSAENAQALLGDCDQGNKIVKLTYSNWRARTVCGFDWTCQSNFTFPQNRIGNTDPISGVLCLEGTSNPMEYVHVTPDPNDADSYIISSTKPDFLTSDLVSFGLLKMFFARHRLYRYMRVI